MMPSEGGRMLMCSDDKGAMHTDEYIWFPEWDEQVGHTHTHTHSSPHHSLRCY
jgi:hypothetical protein